MQDPKKDISNIVQTLCTTRNGNDLEKTIERYYAADAKLSHPLCSANSRDEILGFFQWYRLASPETQVNVSSVMYDSELNVLVMEVMEKVNMWFSPFPGAKTRLIVRLQLRKTGNSYQITKEEDLVQPMDQIGLLGAPLLPLASFTVRLGCIVSNLGACACRFFGFNSGLQGGNMNYAGLMGSLGMARKSGDTTNGSAKD